jgi:predicted transcriptional regulator
MISSIQHAPVDTGKRRSKLKICYEALHCINHGEKSKTRIMNKCGISTHKMNQILDQLSNNLLIQIDKTKKRHKIGITPKGENVLEYLESVFSLMHLK